MTPSRGSSDPKWEGRREWGWGGGRCWDLGAGTPPRVRASRPLGSGSWAAERLNQDQKCLAFELDAGRLEWSDRPPPRPQSKQRVSPEKQGLPGPGEGSLA